tara:strand:+ start:118 stop:663 length:546 start_codon:yes stop_codon:yes gene_type:complete
MGLKDDLINAKLSMIDASGGDADKVDTSPGSPIDVECELTKEAIVNLLTQADFTVTQLKAPVIVESLKTPEQPVNIELDTLLAEYVPLLKVLKKIGDPLGLGKLIDELETQIEKAITPVLQGGAKLAGLDLGKDSGGLESSGYVYIGEDPDSQDSFDVDDEDGQRDFTTVKLIREDIEDLL